MLMTVLIAFLVFVLAVLLMSLGVMLSGRRIQGSCGGLGNIPGIESDCGGLCRGDGDTQRTACRRHSRPGAEDDIPGCDRRGAGSEPTGPGTSSGNTR